MKKYDIIFSSTKTGIIRTQTTALNLLGACKQAFGWAQTTGTDEDIITVEDVQEVEIKGNHPRTFQVWSGHISLTSLRDELNQAAAQSKPLDLSTLQDARDIVEALLHDDVTYDSELCAYLPQQTENNPHFVN